MTFQLNIEESQFVDGLVAAGTYKSSEDAVREAFRLLMSREKLKAELQLGLDDLEAGRIFSEEEVFAELEAELDRLDESK